MLKIDDFCFEFAVYLVSILSFEKGNGIAREEREKNNMFVVFD